MAILNPEHLLEQADYLLQARNSLRQVRQADRRRAISSAYYAVFHLTLTAFADEFVGKSERKTVRYALAYRSLDHRALETLCKVISKEQIPVKYSKFFPQNGVGASIQEFAALFIELKEKRTSADYDPSHWIRIADAQTAISSARSAIIRFKASNLSRRKAFLTLLAFPPR